MALSLSFSRSFRVVTHMIPKECEKSRGFMIICWNNYIINSMLCQWSVCFANMKRCVAPWSTRELLRIFARVKRSAHKPLREPKARFTERSSASFFMHRRCASLQPKTKKQSNGLLSFLVAEMGFEPHDLRVMSPTSYQTAPLRDMIGAGSRGRTGTRKNLTGF